MKILSILIVIFLSLPTWALTKTDVKALLKEKNISLQELERAGAKVLLGEVTGHIEAVPFSKVHALLTEVEAILVPEIDAVDFQGKELLGNITAVHYQNQYLLKQDVKGVIVE